MTCPPRDFYPRSPCGERLFNACCTEPIHTFLSTLSLRRATLPPTLAGVNFEISIHALLAESDLLYCFSSFFYLISIHALLAESDIAGRITLNGTKKFLSTLSLRRATLSAALCGLIIKNFYPRSPCGERLRGVSLNYKEVFYFYPRSPCGERLIISLLVSMSY